MKAAESAKHVEVCAHNSFQPELAIIQFLFLVIKFQVRPFGLAYGHNFKCNNLGEILYYLLEVEIR